MGDYDQILALWKRTEGIGISDSDSREAIASFLKRNPSLSLVAACGSRVIATLLCGHDGRRGYLHHLAVAKAWRRQGIGQSLVKACLAKLHEKSIPKCNLFLFASNRSGRRFWERLGWSVRSDLTLAQCATSGAPAPCGKSC
jgi:ribosomal protein S18 acetylase RimI-like enzyme